MKKIICLILALVLALGLCSCGAADSDKAYVQEKGKLVVGVTVFEPMDFKDANDQWVGFDADMAKAFAAKLGVDVEFQIINWS